MSTEHTPGPWMAIDNDPGITTPGVHQAWILAAPGSVVVADVTRVADAHLIAAAPDLLDAAKRALYKLLADWDREEGHPLHVAYENEPAEASRLRDAIARAEGRS